MIKESNQLTRLVEKALPALSGSSVTYNEQKNIYLSQGYTSAAGNTYFQGIRLSDRIIVNYDFGQGYAYLFLNGIRIYGYDGKEKRLISSRSFYCTGFSESFAKLQCEEMLQEYLRSQMKMLNSTVDEQQVCEFSKRLVSETLTSQKLLS